MNVSETTQELIEKRYANIFSKNKAIDFTEEPSDQDYIKVDEFDNDLDFEEHTDLDRLKIDFKDQHQPIKPYEEFKDDTNNEINDNTDDSKISNRPNLIGPLEISHDDPTSSDNDSRIIVTEVNLVTPEIERKPRYVEKIIGDEDKQLISNEILETLLREIQEYMFPIRVDHSSDSKKKFESKYNERVPQNVIPNRKWLTSINNLSQNLC